MSDFKKIELKPEIKKAMEKKSTEYIDWEKLYQDGGTVESGVLEAKHFCEGFKYAVYYLSCNGLIKGGIDEQL